MVVSPKRIPSGASIRAKTDAIDCITLANLAGKGMLRSIAIPTAAQEANRGLTRRRTQLVTEDLVLPEAGWDNEEKIEKCEIKVEIPSAG